MARTPKPSGRRRRPAFESDIRRTQGTRADRDRLLVVCGAAVTEKDYLQGLVDHLANPAVTVRIKTKACSPIQLVDYAAQEQSRSRDEFDQIWCVFDVDDVDSAMIAARRNDIETAVSNPCFELWLILHFSDHRAHAATYKQLVPVLKQHVPAFDKTRINFRDYQGGWLQASRRARQLSAPGEEHFTNPATSAWRLIDRIAER